MKDNSNYRVKENGERKQRGQKVQAGRGVKVWGNEGASEWLSNINYA